MEKASRKKKQNFYEVLGVNKKSPINEIKVAYKKLALVYSNYFTTFQIAMASR